MSSNNVEERMWSLMKDQTDFEGTTVRIAYLACNRLPIHKERAVNIVKKWDNRGLVTALNGGTRAILTPEGLDTNELKIAN